MCKVGLEMNFPAQWPEVSIPPDGKTWHGMAGRVMKELAAAWVVAAECGVHAGGHAIEAVAQRAKELTDGPDCQWSSTATSRLMFCTLHLLKDGTAFSQFEIMGWGWEQQFDLDVIARFDEMRQGKAL